MARYFFRMLNAAGEFFDLEVVLNRTKDSVPPKIDIDSEEHCTGFVKIAPGNKDLFFAQVSMNKLNTMTRVLKLIKMGYGRCHDFFIPFIMKAVVSEPQW
jgi:hypothetical protein